MTLTRKRATRGSALLQAASFLALAHVATAQAQQAAQTQNTTELPEQVLVTGSLIHGATAVGVPVTALSDQDFKESGALTIADVLKEVPSLVVQTSNVGTPGQTGTVTRPQQVLIRGVPKETLMMIDGMRFPFQNFSTCYVDPSIIPQLAVQHIDVLADGASATYGSDAVTGVINVVLKRGFDGAISQFRYARSADIGNANYQATQLYGRTWNTGDVTMSYEWYHEDNVHGVVRPYFTFNYEPYGFDDVTPIGAAMPGVVSTGALVAIPALAAQGFAAGVGSCTCANCYSIPAGAGWNYGDSPAHTNPTNPGSVPTTSWTTLLSNAGVKTLRNPYEVTDILPTQDRSAATITFDQHLFPGISFFGDAFYSNRKAVQFGAPGQAPAAAQTLSAVAVPTTNPYYPSGAPVGLRVSYDLAIEQDTRVNSGETAERYDFGFNADLPFDWRGRLYYSMSRDQIFDHDTGNVNVNMVNAALGNTVASVAANGSTPGQAAFVKPANIPYLNLFCDATQFQCNSQITLDYIGAYRTQDQHWQLTETGVNLDGPVIELPGGMLRAAVGANSVSQHYLRDETSNFSTVNTSVVLRNPQPANRSVWAAFGQLNVPLVGEGNSIPLVKAFDIEAALRYDRYDQFGGVTTPKLAATWNVGYGFSLRGTWGKSFRAPVFSEATATGGLMIQPVNTTAGASTNTVTLSCPTVPGQTNAATAANAGSLNAYLNPTCSNSAATLTPAGIRLSGGSGAALAAGVRAGQALGPENAKNWALGFNFTPTDLLAGLSIDATWYHVIINNLIGANTGGLNVNDPAAVVCTGPTPGCIYLVRPNPNLPITDPSNASFLAIASNLLADPHSTVLASVTTIQFINDAAITNLGYRQLSGIDFSARYDFDLADWGAWNVGIDGNYKAQDKIKAVLSGPVSNDFQLLGSSVPIGSDTGGLLKYRGRVGWAATEGPADGLSITAFVNFIPHSVNWAQIATTYVPPKCFWATGFSAGSCYPGSPYWGPYDTFPNSVPSQYTFDLSLGYQTGTKPANQYLQNLNIQFTVLNLLNRTAPFVYALGGSRTFPGVQAIPPDQRYLSFAVTKAW